MSSFELSPPTVTRRSGSRVQPATEHVDIGDELLGVVVADVLAEREAAAGERRAVSIGEREGAAARGRRRRRARAGRRCRPGPSEDVHVREMRRDLRELGERVVGR